MAKRPDNLLVVAPEVPRHDQNSGDLRLFSLLKILAHSHCIHYVTPGPPGPQEYADDLRSIGVTVLPAGASFAGLLRGRRFKTALLEFYHVAEHYLPRIRLLQPKCRVVVDTVDVHFLREAMRGRVTGDDRAVERAASTKTRELNIYAQADMVITVTEDDAHALLPHCERRRVRVIPNVHELARPRTRASSATLVFVGGFKHFPNVDAVTYLCREILPLVRQRVPTVHLTIVGSNPPPEVWALREDHVLVTGFVPSTTPYLHSSRVSVAPLRFGAGMKGKIGEAMAHGVPVVTTTVGAQGMRLQHGINVLIADKPASFAAAVVDLLTDDILHDRITRNALDHLARHFTPIQAGAALTAAFGDLDALPLKRMPLSGKARFLGGWALGRIRSFFRTAEP